ncbi:diguanylate cyclase domain-containing protein [Pseudarthrobacter sp. NPDC058362]|uniref:diguanylate cyclase domain-containing protein n=1 Tax=unclassified Pseudarthrobacter TaxID=2647000 RepID=UPI003651B6DC
MDKSTASPATWSLQREWSRAFIVMLLALLLGAVITIVGVRSVLGQVEGAAARLQAEYASVATLAEAVDGHEQLGHQLLSGARVNREAFVLEQQDIEELFQAAAETGDRGRSEILSRARQYWQSGLEKGGLWGAAALNHAGNDPAAGTDLAAAGSKVRTHLSEVQRSSIQALNSGLVDTSAMERLLTIARIGLLLAAIGVTLYFRRRMVTDLIRPVNSLRQGVQKLQAGDFGYRVEVARRDELGEVAVAFNGMAAALEDSHQSLTYRATHDALTGLVNRAGLAERLAAWFEQDDAPGPPSVGLLFIDIDDFKDVNDSLGHEGGDELLVQLARRLRSSVRAHDVVARLGGDEFAVVVFGKDANSPPTESVIERIYAATNEPFMVGGRPVGVSLSMGVARRAGQFPDLSELLREADAAMYRAKHTGKARYENFS